MCALRLVFFGEAFGCMSSWVEAERALGVWLWLTIRVWGVNSEMDGESEARNERSTWAQHSYDDVT